MSDIPNFDSIQPSADIPDFNSIQPSNGVPNFDAIQPEQSIGVLDTALWALRPFFAIPSAAQAPLAHDFKATDVMGQAKEAFSVSKDAFLKDLFPKYGSHPTNYVGKALEDVDMPEAIRPTAEILLSIVTDPTIIVTAPFAKTIEKGLELAKQTGDYSDPFVNALKEFVSVVPMSPTETAHFTKTAANADLGDVKSAQEMIDEFVLPKDAASKGKKEAVAIDDVPLHPSRALDDGASISQIENVVKDIKSKNPETLKNMHDLEDFDKLQLKARTNVMDKIQAERALAETKLLKESTKEATTAMNEHEVYQFIDKIRESGGISAKGLPDDIAAVLKDNHNLIKDTGKTYIQVAKEFGLENADKMVNRLAHIGSKKEAIRSVTRAMFNDSKKDLKSLEDIDIKSKFLDEEMKLAGVKFSPAVYKLVQEFKGSPSKEISDKIVSLLEAENKGVKLPSSSDVKKLVRENTRQKTVGKMVSEEAALKASMKKAEQGSRIGFRAGKLEAMLEYKVRLNAYKAAVQERKVITKYTSKLKRFQKLQTVPLEFMEQMQSVIGNKIVPLAAKFRAKEPPKSFDDWLGEIADAGDELFAQTIKIMKDDLPAHRDMSMMTADDLKKLSQFAESMAYAGVTEGKFLSFKSEKTFNESINIGVDNIQKTWGTQNEIPTVLELQEAKSRIVRTALAANDLRKELLATNVRPKFIPIALDGQKLDGHMTTLLERPIVLAQREESVLSAKVAVEADSAFKPFGKGNALKFNKWRDEAKIFTTEDGRTVNLSKMKQVMMAVNARANMKELARGMTITKKDVNNIIETLSTTEKKLVDDILNIYKQFYEPSNNILMKIMNKRLEKIKGYFPIVEDTRLIAKAGGKQNIKALFESSKERDLFSTFQRKSSNTKGSQRKERTGGAGTIRLDFDVIHNTLNNTIHDITHALPVRDVQKVLSNEKMKKAIYEALGENAHAQLVSSLQHVARPVREGMSIAERAVGTARSLTTMAILGANFAVGLKQTLSLTQAVRELGALTIGKEVVKYWTNPIAFRKLMKQIDDMEPLIAHRGNALDRDLRDNLAVLIPDKYSDAFFAWIRFNDRLAVYPTYIAAFKREMKEHGDIDKAKRIALDIVEITQPTNYAKDLAATMRGSEYQKTFKSFMSFFSVMTNQFNRAAGQRKLLRLEGKNLEAAIQAARTYWWLLAVPSYLATSVDKGRPATVKEATSGMISMRTAGHPLARVLNAGLFGAYDPQLNPTTSTILKMMQSARRHETQDVVTLMGYFLGVPTKPFIRFGEGMEDLYDGKTNYVLAPLLGEPDKPEEFDFIERL